MAYVECVVGSWGSAQEGVEVEAGAAVPRRVVVDKLRFLWAELYDLV